MAAGISAGTAFIDILPNMAQFAAATSAGMRKLGPQLTAVGAKMTRGLTLPIAGAGVAITKMSLDFSDSLTNIRALVGASDKEIAQYRRGILALAGETTKGPRELASSLYFLASAGFEGEKALKVLAASARASSAGLGNTEDVAKTVGAAVNAYGEKALSAKDATDVLVAAVREGTAEPAELANALGRVIAPAQAVGVEFREVGGAVAGLTLTGLDANEAVTALRGVLVSFLGPGTQAKETLKKFGFTAKEVQEDIAKKGLLSTLQNLRDTFGEDNDAMRKLFPNVRAFNGFLALTGRNAEKNAKAMDAVVHSTGDADKAFEKASESLGFKLRNSLAKLETAAIKLGDILLPIVAEGAEKLAALGEAFSGLDPKVQKVVVWGGLILAALGPVVFLLGQLTTAVGAVISAFVVLEKTAAGATAFRSGWLLALATNPWVLAAGAIIGVAVALKQMEGASTNAEESVRNLTDATREYISASAELNQSSRDLTQAQITEKQSALAVKTARTNLTKVMNNEKSTALQIKQARLGVQQAELDHANALARLTEAQDHNRASQEALIRAREEARGRIRDMNAALLQELGVLRGVRGPAKQTAEQQRALVQAADPNKIYKFVDGLIANAAAFNSTRKEAGKAREDIFNFIQETGKIPDNKQLEVIVNGTGLAAGQLDDVKDHLDNLHDKVITVTLQQRGSTAAIGTNAGGTNYWRGGLTWVGEEGPEILNVPRGSQIIPNHEIGKYAQGRGGKSRLVITNWEEGTGYIEEIADDSVASGGRHSRQKRRMH